MYVWCGFKDCYEKIIYLLFGLTGDFSKWTTIKPCTQRSTNKNDRFQNDIVILIVLVESEPSIWDETKNQWKQKQNTNFCRPVFQYLEDGCGNGRFAPLVRYQCSHSIVWHGRDDMWYHRYSTNVWKRPYIVFNICSVYKSIDKWVKDSHP